MTGRDRLVGTAVAVCLMVSLVGGGAVAQTSSPPPAASPAAGASPDAGASPAAVASTAPALLTWQRVEKLPSKKAAATDSTLNAAGQVVLLAPLAEYPGTPAYVWRSTDGLTYQTSKPLKVGKASAKVDGGRLGTLVRAGDDLLSFGRSAGPGGLLRSTDGAEWKIQSEGLPGSPEIGAAGSSTAGIVLAGISGKVPHAWTSQDGRTWVQGDLPFDGEGNTPYPRHAAVSPSGAWVVGSLDTGGLTAADNMLWASPDGATWQAVPLPIEDDGSTKAYINSLTSTPTGLLMVLSVGDSGGSPQSFWTSTDGITWQPAYEPAQRVGFVSSPVMTASGVSPGIVAVTYDASMVSPEPGHLLLSPDGTTWTEQPLPPLDDGVRPLTAAVMADGTVIVSAAKSDGSYPTDAALYVGTPAP